MLKEMSKTIEILKESNYNVTQENENSILAENELLIGAFTVQRNDITGRFFVKSYKPVLLQMYGKNTEMGWEFYKAGINVRKSCGDCDLTPEQLQDFIQRAERVLARAEV